MLRERTDQVWHCYLPDVRPGQFYGYRVHGAVRAGARAPLQPREAADRSVRQGDHRRDQVEQRAVRLQGRTARAKISSPIPTTAPAACRSRVVIDPAFTWEDDRPLHIPWNRTIIYECHVKGMTKLHPDVPENLRGTYLGLCSDPMIEYFLVARRHRDRAAAGAPVRRRPASRRARAHELLGLQLDRLLRARRALRHARTRQSGLRVQEHGEDAPLGGHRSDSRRRLQPHRRRQSSRADAVAARHRQSRVLPARARISASTRTSPARATASTCSTRARSSSSWIRCATG